MTTPPISSKIQNLEAVIDTIILAGEITCSQEIDYEKVARSTAASIGYTNHEYGMDAGTCDVKILISNLSMI